MTKAKDLPSFKSQKRSMSEVLSMFIFHQVVTRVSHILKQLRHYAINQSPMFLLFLVVFSFSLFFFILFYFLLCLLCFLFCFLFVFFYLFIHIFVYLFIHFHSIFLAPSLYYSGNMINFCLRRTSFQGSLVLDLSFRRWDARKGRRNTFLFVSAFV